MSLFRTANKARQLTGRWNLPLNRSTGLIVALAAAAAIVGFMPARSTPLPDGYLTARGSQIVDKRGHPVRIISMGGFGTVVVGGSLDYNFGAYTGLDPTIAELPKLGFNCIRADFNDKNVLDPAMMAQFDQLVSCCKKYGVKVILDHHNNEATPANWGNAAQQTNGLWYDSGPNTDGTDGAGDKGTVTPDQFKADWVALATRYAGNSTVIGFDLDNEPHVGYGQPYNGLNWGGGGTGDIRAMFTSVGDAILAVDPGALIICEGPMDVTDKSSIIWWSMDLSHVATMPVVLTEPDKVVYSVHEYPSEVSGSLRDHGPEYVAQMNADWGYLVAKNIAPVWVGELGAPTSSTDTDGNAWAKTVMAYLDGEDGALDGPSFSGAQQPIGIDLWRWGSAPQVGDGCLASTGQIRPEIKYFVDSLVLTR